MDTAELKCPACEKTTRVGIPKNRCLAWYACEHCDFKMKAKKLCCVVCEFSDKTCDHH